MLWGLLKCPKNKSTFEAPQLGEVEVPIDGFISPIQQQIVLYKSNKWPFKWPESSSFHIKKVSIASNIVRHQPTIESIQKMKSTCTRGICQWSTFYFYSEIKPANTTELIFFTAIHSLKTFSRFIASFFELLFWKIACPYIFETYCNKI